MKQKGSAYDLLGVDITASPAEIRKAYLKLAVQLHPDKSSDDPEIAKERFQSLQKVYSILSDPEKRKVYDQTGSLDDSEELTSEQFNNLYNYYKSQFAPVTEESIAAFEASYRGSEEEQNDVLQYYDEFEGNMDKAFEWILLSDPNKDSHRFRDIIEDAIEKNIVNRYKSFDAWARKVNKRPPPSEEANLKNEAGKKSNKKKKNGKNTDDTHSELVALIKNRQNAQNSLLDSFATKYGVSIGGIEEPSEEEFNAARKRILQQNKKG